MIKHSFAAAIVLLALPAGVDASGPKHCPPGLAKKNPACVPPGLAKKGNTTGAERTRVEDRADRYTELRPGDRVRLEGRDYVVVSVGDVVVLRRDDDTLYRLPRPRDDLYYVRIGDVIVRVDRETKRVFDIIRLAELILN